jgi:hypothetical protein
MFYLIDEMTRTIYVVPNDSLAYQLNDGVQLDEMIWMHSIVCPSQESAAFVNAESISYIGKSATLCSKIFFSSENNKFVYTQTLSVGEAGFGSRFIFALSYHAHHVLGTTRRAFETFAPVDAAAASGSILTQRPRQRPDPRLIRGARLVNVADLTALDRLFVASTPTIGFSFRSCIANLSNASAHETTRRIQERELARVDYMLKSLIHLLGEDTPPSKRVENTLFSSPSRPPSPFALPPALICTMASRTSPMLPPMSSPTSPTSPVSNLLHLPSDVLSCIFKRLVSDIAKCVDSRAAANTFTKTRLVCKTFLQMIDEEGDDHVKNAKSAVAKYLRTGTYKRDQDQETTDVSSHVYSTMACSPFLLISLETATMRNHLLIRIRSQLGTRVCAARAAANRAHIQRVLLPDRVDKLLESECGTKKEVELENRHILSNANGSTSGRCSPAKLLLPTRILQIVQIIQN